MALDAVSLVTSKDAPKQAELTMSPYLKQQIKPGTLGLDMWSNMPIDREMQDTDEAISRGWRMQSLQACADSLLGAAARLEKNVRRETRYWENILSVSERGWSICRMPRERHNLGVRFGFLEAYGEYRDRGLAALRADESGNVILDKGFGNKPKSIRVCIRHASQIVGMSTPSSLIDESEQTLETRIRAARDSLYEEELFHEVIRESRTLASYGIEMNQSTIYLPSRLDAREVKPTDQGFDGILIDLTSPDETNGESGDLPQDQYAQAVALAFRLLLSYAHKERLKRRSDIPAPMSLNRQETPVVPILRPVLTLLHHRSISSGIDGYLGRLSAILANASVQASVQAAKFDDAFLGEAQSMEILMRKLMAPIQSQSSLSLHVPGRNEPLQFTLHLYTSSSAPALGSRIQISTSVGPPMDIDELEDVVDYLDVMVADALAVEVAKRLPGWSYNDKVRILSNPGSEAKVCVTIDSGMNEADEGSKGHVLLDTGNLRVQWEIESRDEEERQFWDIVDEIK